MSASNSDLYAKSGVREVSFRYDLYRNGAPFKRLDVQSASISMRSDAEIKTSLNLTMTADTDINYMTDTIAPFMLINGEEFPLGRFVPITPVFSYANGITTADIECYDMAVRLKQHRAFFRVFLSKGANCMSEAARLINEVNIAVADYVDTNVHLTTDREDWEEDACYLDIVNSLLTEACCHSLYFDTEGRAVMEPLNLPRETAHVYSAGEYSVVEEASSVENDMYEAYNSFRAVVSNPDLDEPLVAYSFVLDENCPFSLANTSMRAAPMLHPEGITTQEALQSYVDRAARSETERIERVTITTALMPNHGVFDRVLLNKANASGIYTETAWSMELRAGGAMTHTLERSVLT